MAKIDETIPKEVMQSLRASGFAFQTAIREEIRPPQRVDRPRIRVSLAGRYESRQFPRHRRRKGKIHPRH
jgi:hypothetical protein